MRLLNGLQLWLAFSAALSFFLAGYAVSMRRTRGALEVAAFSLAAGVYALGYAFELSRGDLDGMLAVVRIEYTAIPLIPYFWLLFAIHFTRHRPLNRLAALLLFLPSALVILGFWTDPWHHLFYTRTWVSREAPFPLIGFERGPAYFFNIAITQLELAAGIVLLFVYAAKAEARYRRQARLAAAGSILPLIMYVAYLFGLSPWNLDLTPFGIVYAGAVFALAIFRFGILELAPAARELAIDSLPDGFLVLDRRMVVEDSNEAAKRLLGGLVIREGEILRAAGEDLTALEALRSLAEEGRGTKELGSAGSAGGDRLLSIRAQPVMGRRGAAAGSVLVIRDITESANLLSRLAQMASTDSLTGLLNRRRFFELGEREVELSRRSGRPIVAAILDLDRFKQINDSLGHAAGDEALRVVGSRLSASLRATDLLCRFGGEEFAILLPDTAAEPGERIVERCRASISSEAFEWKGESYALRASAGCCSGPLGPAEDLHGLLDRADTALYRAKAEGRDRLAAWAL